MVSIIAVHEFSPAPAAASETARFIVHGLEVRPSTLFELSNPFGLSGSSVLGGATWRRFRPAFFIASCRRGAAGGHTRRRRPASGCTWEVYKSLVVRGSALA